MRLIWRKASKTIKCDYSSFYGLMFASFVVQTLNRKWILIAFSRTFEVFRISLVAILNSMCIRESANQFKKNDLASINSTGHLPFLCFCVSIPISIRLVNRIFFISKIYTFTNSEKWGHHWDLEKLYTKKMCYMRGWSERISKWHLNDAVSNIIKIAASILSKSFRFAYLIRRVYIFFVALTLLNTFECWACISPSNPETYFQMMQTQ